MTLFQLKRLPQNVAGRQRIVVSDICWFFGNFLRYRNEKRCQILSYIVVCHFVLQTCVVLSGVLLLFMHNLTRWESETGRRYLKVFHFNAFKAFEIPNLLWIGMCQQIWFVVPNHLLPNEFHTLNIMVFMINDHSDSIKPNNRFFCQNILVDVYQLPVLIKPNLFGWCYCDHRDEFSGDFVWSRHKTCCFYFF